MNEDHNNDTKLSPDSVSKNTLHKVIIGGLVGTLLAKVVTLQSIAHALGMSTGGLLISCIIIARLISILVRMRSAPVVAEKPSSAPGIKECPIAEQAGTSNGG